ncbi:hypothetical protein L1049_011787 [Liquidambar formosana]|uniref:RNA polymerase sigma-70 domain-containing protein n=1 Tax=Liquidambar formosana TaxID=63359 RepID=A0AAP0X3B6_LIQFO
MAITICSSPTHSPTLPTVSLPLLPAVSTLKTLHSLQPPTISTSSSFSSKFNLGLVSDDAVVIANAAEAVALASAGVQAARDALSSASATGDILVYEESENGSERDGSNVVGVRRRKRRKRRKGSESTEENWEGEDQQVLFRSAKAGYLTRKEEAELSMCLKEGARLEAARRRMTEPGECEPTSNQWAKTVGLKRRSLDRKLCNGREARERITRSYRRLIVSIATGYQGKGLSLQDLIQEGSIGLLRGAERFDPERGYKLSTYAYWWIRQAIIRAIEKKSRVVRLPGSMCEMLAKIAEANNVLSKRLRRFPTYDEIAEVLNVHVSTVKLVSDRSRPPISLDGAATDQGFMTLQVFLLNYYFYLL